MLYMSLALGKASIFAQKMNLTLLQTIATLPMQAQCLCCPMLLSGGHSANPMMSQLRE